MKDLVTVVVPVYNIEDYVEKCVDSILKQTYTNLEIILVDDGSTDSSSLICDQYREKDSRIIVIHKPNGGLSDARNAGIELSHGKYIAFIDGDDWINEEYINYLYNLIIAEGADISECGFIYIDEHNNILNKLSETKHDWCLDSMNALRYLLVGKDVVTSAWGKLYKASLFDDLRYPVGKLYEDIPVTYASFLKADKIAFGGKSLYYYLYRPGSISISKFKDKRMDADFLLKKSLEKVMEKYPCLTKECKIALFRMSFGIMLELDDSSVASKYKKYILDNIRETRMSVIGGRDVPWGWRIKALISCMGMKITQSILKGR